MPIQKAILERIRANDPTLIELDLSRQGLTDNDIIQLVKTLSFNTTVVSLNVSCNKFGLQGIAALAQNETVLILDLYANQLGDQEMIQLSQNTSLQMLRVARNQVSVKGAMALAGMTNILILDVGENLISNKGAAAFAQNKTLKVLNLFHNLISNIGAKTFAENKTLTALNLYKNMLTHEILKQLNTNTSFTTLAIFNNAWGTEWAFLLEQMLKQYEQDKYQRKKQFIQVLDILARDRLKPHSNSLWSKLPQELIVPLLSQLSFKPKESIGKNPEQIKQCVEFIFSHLTNLFPLFVAKQGLRIIEKRTENQQGVSFFFASIKVQNPNQTQQQEQFLLEELPYHTVP